MSFQTRPSTVSILKQRTVQLALACSLALGASAHAATDMFLEVDGIKGDSQDAYFTQAISVVGAATNFNRKGCGAVVIQKYVDSATAPIIASTVSQKLYPEMTLSYRKPGGAAQVNFELKLTTARFVRSTSDNTSAGDQLMETVRIRAETIDVVYTPIDATGSPEAPIVSTVMCTDN